MDTVAHVVKLLTSCETNPTKCGENRLSCTCHEITHLLLCEQDHSESEVSEHIQIYLPSNHLLAVKKTGPKWK